MRDVELFQHEAYLHARVPRTACDRCGVKLVEVPWARAGSGFTLLFEAMMMAFMKGMPVAAMARLVGEHDSKLWRTLHHHVDSARKEVDTVEKHRAGILRWFRTRISNGLLEGLSSLVQAAKARFRGYRSTRNLTAMIYLMHGKHPIYQST